MNSVPQQYAPTLQKILLFGLFFALIFLSFSVLKYFIVPVVWATIFAYMTWPLYQKVLRLCNNRSTLSATLMILLVVLVVGLPVIFAIFLLQHEGRNLYYELQKQVFSGHVNVPDFIRQLPFIGKEVSRTLRELNNDPNSIIQSVQFWIQGHLNYGKILLNGGFFDEEENIVTPEPVKTTQEAQPEAEKPKVKKTTSVAALNLPVDDSEEDEEITPMDPEIVKEDHVIPAEPKSASVASTPSTGMKPLPGSFFGSN